jgi:hypothetical protein
MFVSRSCMLLCVLVLPPSRDDARLDDDDERRRGRNVSARAALGNRA